MSNSSDQNTKPVLKNYLSVQQYLGDLYVYRKRHEADFSYEKWAAEIGIKNRSYLRLVISGRRLVSPEVMELFIRHLLLEGTEKEYFTYLVLYSQSRHENQKRLYGRKLISLIKHEPDQFEIERHYDFVSDPLLPKLRTMLAYDDIRRTPDVLAGLLNISEVSVKAGLNKLHELGLAEATENGWRALHKDVKVRDHAADVALHQFHTHSLQEAIKAHHLSADLRKFRSVLMAMNESEYQGFLDDFQIFMSSQISKHNSGQLQDRRLYHINFNLFPLSRKAAEA